MDIAKTLGIESFPLLGAFLRLRPIRHELRVVPAVEEDHAVQFIALYDRPATTRAFVHLGTAFPGPFQGGFSVSLGLHEADVAAHEAKLELPASGLLELDERLTFFGNVVV